MSDHDQDEPVERLLDLLVYAPIGLALDIESVGPDLARRGRQHARAARQIGEFAVRAGLKRLDEAIEAFAQPDSADTATTGPDPAEAAAESGVNGNST